jgi:hypothetical protein
LKKVHRAEYLLLVLFLMLITTGCGLKGNPVAHSRISQLRPQIINLEPVSLDDSVLLKWKFQDENGLINYINIERSEAGASGNECKDCPRTFEKIGSVSVKRAMSVDKEQKALSFADKKAVRGKTYKYLLKMCEENGNCSESSIVEIKYQ